MVRPSSLCAVAVARMRPYGPGIPWPLAHEVGGKLFALAPKQEQSIKFARESLINPVRWTSGVLNVPSTCLDLVHFPTVLLPFSLVRLNSSVPQDTLKNLASAYEKGDIGSVQFASFLDVKSTGILSAALSNLLSGHAAEKPILAEVWSLNVFGQTVTTSSQDVSRKLPESLGTLVVTFPTTHTGGGLALRYDNQEATIDVAHALQAQPGTDKIAYTCFLSDVECNTLTVTDGYQVSLTYNLFYAKPHSDIDNIPSASRDVIEKVKTYLQGLLDDPTFLPRGGLFGFGLQYTYPDEHPDGLDSKRTECFNHLKNQLKGSDSVIQVACSELGIPASLKVLVEEQDCYGDYQPPAAVLLSSPPRDCYDGEMNTLTSWLQGEQNGEYVHDITQPWEDDHFTGEKSKEIAWVTPRNKHSQFKGIYMSRRLPEPYYSELCLIARFGPIGDRLNPGGYEGVELFYYEVK
ncbi:hypothetical protein DL96DRAFT_1712027 [Flagelloscypha sp. PMI_526]|nr:hypothetical protein DL96DRAFT_1712027 [Flagelloscypha sp. PMI_526]